MRTFSRSNGVGQQGADGTWRVEKRTLFQRTKQSNKERKKTVEPGRYNIVQPHETKPTANLPQTSPVKAPAAILMSKGEVFSLLPPLGGHMVSVESAVKR